MGLTLNALKRGLVSSLAGLLVASAPAALAGSAADTRATTGDDKPQITLHGRAYDSWQLFTSGTVTVDGHVAKAYDRITNGSRIVVAERATARAEIEGVGRLSIAPRSEVVLSMDDDTVVARMLHGNMRVETAAQFGAYVETPDKVVVAHPGTYASFRVSADPLGTNLERTLGDVEMTAALDDPGDWDLEDVDPGDHYYVKARHKETIKVKVKKNGDHAANQPVNFAITEALNGATASFEDGTQRVTVVSDSDGIAKVEIEVGASAGKVIVEAAVPGTEASEILHLTIDAPEKTFWNKYTVPIYAAIGAGAVAGAIIAIKNSGGEENNPQIVPQPPVVTVP